MPWIESHLSLVHHPKLVKLARLTGWTLNESIGVMHRLWWWALAYQEDGNLSDYSAEEIGDALNLTETDKFKHKDTLFVLKESKFVTKTNFIKNWLEYSLRYFMTKYRTNNPNKLIGIIERFDAGTQSDHSQTVVKLKSDTLPNQPNQPTKERLMLISRIIQDLNKVTGKKYRPQTESTVKALNGRIEEGYTFEDFKRVHRVKHAEWGNKPEMEQYLRPSTLYRPGNFESYINKVTPEEIHNREKAAERKKELLEKIEKANKEIKFRDGLLKEMEEDHPQYKEHKDVIANATKYIARREAELKGIV